MGRAQQGRAGGGDRAVKEPKGKCSNEDRVSPASTRAAARQKKGSHTASEIPPPLPLLTGLGTSRSARRSPCLAHRHRPGKTRSVRLKVWGKQ